MKKFAPPSSNGRRGGNWFINCVSAVVETTGIASLV